MADMSVTFSTLPTGERYMVEFETTIDFKTYKERNRYACLRTTFYKWYAYIVVILAAGYLLGGALHFPPLPEAIFTIILVVIVTRYVFLRIPMAICGTFTETKREDFPITAKFMFDGDGFRIKKNLLSNLLDGKKSSQ